MISEGKKIDADTGYEHLEFGIAMDLSWGGEGPGFVASSSSNPLPQLSGIMVRFLEMYGPHIDFFEFSFQPKDRSFLDPASYGDCYRQIQSRLPENCKMAIHQTTLNMGGLGPHENSAVLDFTNTLISDLGLKWVNEDIGIWSLNGKSLPYPLPPIFSSDTLEHVLDSVRYWSSELNAPLHVEFPGFTDSSLVVLGSMDAFEYFRAVADASECRVTLDVGHILGYLNFIQAPRDEYFDRISTLPLERCAEIHLAGCEIKGNRFYDLHHGKVHTDQLMILDWLLPRCPSLQYLTYEDPNLAEDGTLDDGSLESYLAVKSRIRK